MANRVFHELHARSAFSFLRGTSLPEDLIQRAAHLGMSTLVLTDRDGVYGSPSAHHASRETGVRAIVGSELTMEDGGVLPVIVRSRAGYQNLCRLLTRSKLAAPKGESRVSWQELEAHADGLTALTGDEEGVLHRALNSGEPTAPVLLVQRLCRIFGHAQVNLEIHRHRIPRENHRLHEILDLAAHLRLPVVASNAPYYATSDRRILHDAFTCLRHHTHLDEAGLRLSPNSERHLKNPAQMQSLFTDLPQALTQTQRIVESVDFGLDKLGYEFPKYDVPSGHDQDSFLREVTYQSARHRFPKMTEAVRQQLDHELGLISKLGFSGYFLVVWDIVRWTTENGILVQGRGSAANSAVCYSLGITNADPIERKLLFERFLSEGHTSWPDIDLDLPSGDQRERVIQEMYRRFAPYGAAMTANVITYRGRSAMREMSKVLNLPQDVCERFTDLYANGDFPQTLPLDEQVKLAGLHQGHPRLPALLTLHRQVYRLPRHLGQHSGGMVLCTNGLDGIVPLEPASMPGRVVVQWDKDDCEDLGIIKVDLLGLGMMAVLEETFASSAERGRPIGLSEIPLDDPETFEMMQKADTIGVFQIESRAQMATLPRMKPKEFYDVVIEVAIIRPGPIVGNLMHPYLNRRSGKEKADCIHPLFTDILERTLGVPLFQEQVLKMAMVIAGFSGRDAEELRRAMSFHRSDERIDHATQKLRAAMNERSVEIAVQDKLIESIKAFALYGFPESHAISFALLAYASVWLKVHRAAEFYAALLNCQPMGFYSSATLVRDAKKHGMRFLPVCVAESAMKCTVLTDNTIRLGLNQLCGISRGSLENLLVQRQHQPWRDLADLLSRCPLSRDERRVLAKAGALNILGYHRRSALWAADAPFHDDLLGPLTTVQESPLAQMTPMERLTADYDTTTLTVGAHPMGIVRAQLRTAKRASDLSSLRHGQWVTIVGMVICRQRPGTANGHCFISLEDETGISNAFVRSELFEKKRLVITQEPFLKINGWLQSLEGVISVVAKNIQAYRYDNTKRVSVKSHDFG
ncbi:error-prone DNA polymerase, DnaE-like [Prosthecobacter debontii]|uniref:Error-prone DNA polymerase n=1 Tax=Prosthecobacter debontii TaxID=48467 RepID=A0A1T4YX57_9BACT|nr:error-prone DNA polymerase [Prosthecobacter debontii]SKB06364.1 error-prone DNA polymerase, DnaE-like [Prosthecobacter debontii]